jgi:hypothetical protein
MLASHSHRTLDVDETVVGQVVFQSLNGGDAEFDCVSSRLHKVFDAAVLLAMTFVFGQVMLILGKKKAMISVHNSIPLTQGIGVVRCEGVSA